MYGIGLGNAVLCGFTAHQGRYFLMPRDNLSFYIPIIKSTSLEIDQLLQDISVEIGNFQMNVIKFTEEELYEITMRKLRI